MSPVKKAPVGAKKAAAVRRTRANKSPEVERDVEMPMEVETAPATDVGTQSSAAVEQSLSIEKGSTLTCRHCGKVFSRHWDWDRHEKTHLPDNACVFFAYS